MATANGNGKAAKPLSRYAQIKAEEDKAAAARARARALAEGVKVGGGKRAIVGEPTIANMPDKAMKLAEPGTAAAYTAAAAYVGGLGRWHAMLAVRFGKWEAACKAAATAAAGKANGKNGKH